MQRSRRILIGVYQHIVFSQYLPPLLGHHVMSRFGIKPFSRAYFRGYTWRPWQANPDASNVFASAAFRFGHTMIPVKALLADPTLTHTREVHVTEVRCR